jgi:hypothetical protein
MARNTSSYRRLRKPAAVEIRGEFVAEFRVEIVTLG